MNTANSPVVCVVGLGSMGFGAAISLLRAGMTVRGVDIRPDVLARFAELGGLPAQTPAEGAKGAEALFSFVVNSKQTDQVLFESGSGALESLPKGAVVVSCATVLPAYAESLHETLNGQGFLSLDAPVSGGAAKAASGEMTIIASGSDASFERADPFLKAIASKVYRLGPQPGQGSRLKMINQLLAGVHIAAAAEAMALGIKVGFDPQLLYDVISNSAGSSFMFQNRVPHIVDGDYTPRSAIDIFIKDLGIVLDTGKALDAELPLAQTARRLFAEAGEKGLGREDDAAVVKIYAEQMGLALPPRKQG